MRTKPLLLLIPLALPACRPDAGIRGTYALTAHGREQCYTFSDSGTYTVIVEPNARGEYGTLTDTLFMGIQMPDFGEPMRFTTDSMQFVLRGDSLRSADNYAFFMVRER